MSQGGHTFETMAIYVNSGGHCHCFDNHLRAYADRDEPRAVGGSLKGDQLFMPYFTVGVIGTVIAMIYTIDPIDWTKTLLWGSLAPSACMWIVASLPFPDC